MATGCRIPCKYFVTSGVGQSSADTGSDHYETSCYDIALLDAGIENFNVMMYTSVLPPESEEISIEEAKREALFHHGAVLETIKAQIDGVQGDHLCAGVGRCWVKKKQGDGSWKTIGGFAAEYEGHASIEKASKILEADLRGIFERRYGHQPEYRLEPSFKTSVREMVVDEDFGTCFVALCFVTFEYPEAPMP